MRKHPQLPVLPRQSCPHRCLAWIILVVVSGCGDPDAAHVQGEQAPLAVSWFVESATDAGIVFVHVSGASGAFYLPEIMSGGVALLDFDDDGDLDAYLVQGNHLGSPASTSLTNRLYRNLGDGTFMDCTAGSGAGDTGYGFSAATGDYDGDGDTDLYLTNLGPNVLLRNEGGGRFIDATHSAGVGFDGWSTGAAFVDYDRDGDLDLLVANYLHWSPEGELECFSELGARDYCNPRAYEAPAADVLYRNEGNGRFVDVSGESGIGAKPGTGLGVNCADLTGDGLVDLFIANDGMLDHLWVNIGGGRFEEQGMRLGCASDNTGKAKAGMGVSVADIDSDGDLDLLVGNLFRETDSLFLHENGIFVDATARWGLAARSRLFTRWGLGFVDFDNDGLLGLYEGMGRVRWQADLHSEGDQYAEPNLLFRQVNGRFEEVLPRGGTADLLIATSHGVAFGDLDNDGGMDILVVNRDEGVHLLRNIVPARGHWVMFRLREERGSDAIGAEVRISMQGGGTQRRIVQTTTSYAAACDPRVHFGLGLETRVEAITVRWPDGSVESFGPVPADAIHELIHGQGQVPD